MPGVVYWDIEDAAPGLQTQPRPKVVKMEENLATWAGRAKIDGSEIRLRFDARFGQFVAELVDSEGEVHDNAWGDTPVEALAGLSLT